MAYNFSNFKQKIEETKTWLSNEFGTIRTGRATPSILDSVFVESYGTRMPLKQMASINIEDAKTLRVSPWNTSQIREIERAIAEGNLGLSVVVDDKGLRVIFPSLTTERREALIKLAKEKTEKAKVSIRGERDDVWSDIQNKEKEGGMGEDEKFALKDEMQKIVDAGNKSLEEMLVKKETEIRS
jgi:ribosome recycling factor